MDDDNFTCDNCGGEYHIDDAYALGDDTLCADCFSEQGFSCDWCGEHEYRENEYEAHDIGGLGVSTYTICSNCNEDTTMCEACERMFDTDAIIEGLCVDCILTGNANRITSLGIITRAREIVSSLVGTSQYYETLYNSRYQDQAELSRPQETPETLGVGLDINTKVYQSQEPGKIITDPRPFSAEIECYVPHVIILHDIVDKKLGGTGITHDASLNSGGIELQSPIIAGKKGEEYIQRYQGN